MKHLFRMLCAACCLLSLVACSGKSVPSPGASGPGSTPIRDLRVIPQDLPRFARMAGENTPLLSPTDQALLDARYNSIVFGPWELARPSIKKKDIASLFRSPRGYKMNGQKWTRAEWNAMLANANLASYPNSGRKAIATRHANLRELPTSDMRFSKPTPVVRDNPFDNFQYSSLPQGTPVYVAHISRDRKWFYVETPLAGGWVRSDELGWVSDAVAARYRSDSYVALMQDDVPLMHGGRPVGRAHIGAFFPLARTTAAGYVVLVPVRSSSGNAVLEEVPLTAAQAARKPQPLTAGALARVGQQMMGQPYAWGGMLEDRDCSATTRDMFTPFGLWLPRNSSAQARAGLKQDISGLSAADKKAAIRRGGVPFMTLIWLPGHIALYVGSYQGQPVIFHNMWGIRVVRDGDDDARHVVGRCAITTLEPGRELPNRYKNALLIDRIRAYTILGRD